MKSILPNPTRLIAALAASLSLAAPLFAQTITGTNPVKIFILAGESNMNGKGTITPSTTPGTLDHVVANDPTLRYQFLKSGGSYVTRADVGIRGLGPASTPANLTIGYGSNSGLIGPELGFGHIIGDAFENKVLIVKVGVDGTTLANSFCPPSSRVGEPEPVATTDKGYYYKEIINQVNLAKTALGATPYEVVGLGWHQGWNDRAVGGAYSAAYEVNMANFINDIRSADKGIGVANMPVVIATAAMDWNYHYSEVELAQLKMADATAYPAFVGNVAVVDTRVPYDGLQFWHGTGDSPASEGFHWNRSGKSFLHVGMAIGDAMSSMVPTRIPFRMRASGGPAGVTLTWNNGTEIPTSVRVLRNGVEIAAAAAANPPSFLDATAPLGVNNYELQFTMPVTACPPLTISHNPGITNLKGNQRINGLKLTWDNNRGYTGITVKRNGSVIAASLPGNTTSYTDASPLTGVVTYSAEPVDVGGTPFAVQVTVSGAPSGGAIIYEPFDMTDATTLTGNEGGIGLDGKWDGGTAIEVTSSNLYTFGSLPVFGNRIVRTTSNGSCTIPIGNTLHDAGLMEHGAQLWFSFLCQNPNNSNIHPTLALGDDILTYHNTVAAGGNAIGAKLLLGSRVTGMIHKNGTEVAATATQATIGASEVVLVVGRITWGADASAADTIQIYSPGTDLVLDTPQSVTAVVDQSKFKVLSMWGNGVAPNMDEIRFGDSYLDVIGQGTDTSGDLTPPTPATMSFATPPAATSTTAITMTATTASDANGVQYQFTRYAADGTTLLFTSPWQDSPVYSDTGLNPNTQYKYTVQARDKSVNNNLNTASSPASATTFASDTTPPTPATMSFATPPAATSTSAITMTATTASDASGVEYFFDETSGNPGGTDSGWQDSPVYSDTGLNSNTQYTYTVQARDKSVNNNPNNASSPASATTFAPDTTPPTPATMTWATPPAATGSASITMTANAASDPSGVEYFFDETSGNPGGTDSGWQDSPTYIDSGLNSSTTYTYQFKARDKSPAANETAFSSSAQATTQAPPVVTVLHWDGNDTTANADGGAGTWADGSNNWDSAATAGLNTAWNNTNNVTAIFGGSAGAVTIGAGGVTVGGLTFNTTAYTIDASTNALTFSTGTNHINLVMPTATTAATITGAVAGTDANLVFSSHPLSNATLNFNGTSANGWTGTTTINPNVTLALAVSSQALLNTTGLTLNGGGITLTNTATGSENTIDRISNSAAIDSYGNSTISIANTATASRAYTENIGAITHYNGQLSVGFTTTQNQASNTQTLMVGGLTRSGSTSTIAISGGGSGAGAIGANSNIRINGITTSTSAGEIVGPWMTAGTLLGTQSDWAVYTSDGSSARVSSRGGTAVAETSWTSSSATGNYNAANTNPLASPVNNRLTANRFVNTLRATFAETNASSGVNWNIDIGTDTITFGSHALSNGDVVAFRTAPTGLTDNRPYYVINAAPGTFQLSLTPGGGVLDLTNVQAATSFMATGLNLNGNTLGTSGFIIGTTGVATIGGGSGSTLTLPDTTSGNLYLHGASNYWIDPSIKDNGAGVLTLVKGSTNAVNLIGINTYSGGTVINAGTLNFMSSSSWVSGQNITFGGAGSITASVGALTGGTLTANQGAVGVINGTSAIAFTSTSGTGTIVRNGGGTNVGNLSLGDASLFTGTLQVSQASGTNPNPTVVFSSLGDGGALQYGGGQTDANQTVTIQFNGSSSQTWATRQVQILPRSVTGGSINAPKSMILENTSASATLTINTDLLNSADRTGQSFILGGSNGGNNSFNGVIGNSKMNGAALNVNKNGEGKWILSGSNSYTGTTAINGGTLVITGATQSTSAITFSGSGVLGLTTGTTVNAASATVNFTGRQVLVTGTTGSPSYTLLTAGSITGTAPTLAAGSVSGYVLVLDGNSLKLNSTGAPVGFAAWQAANGGSGTTGGLGADHDNDGVDNGTEFFIYGSVASSGFTPLPGVANNAGVLSVTWTKAAVGYTGSYTTDFVVETSDTLAADTWTAAATNGSANVANTVHINGNNVTYTFPAGTRKFARLKVTGPN